MLSNLQAYTDELVEKYAIPAVSLAIWKDDQLTSAASGILNLNTGVEATTDSIFQIGSITKVFTTCLVMQLVDERKVDLDTPVKHYLRDFQLADTAASEIITVRQLLNHTSGINGDYFPDDEGQSGNLIARYVDRCSLLPLMHPVGKLFCYSNAAFTVAGRLVEVIRDISWHQAMKEYIYQPLGMTHAIADPKDMIRFRTAMGHVLNNAEDQSGKNTCDETKQKWILSDRAYFTLGQAPAGTTPAMTASDLINFARAHLENGLTFSGKRWLSQASVKAMQTPSKAWPLHSQIKRGHVGLGWLLGDYQRPEMRVVGHTGGTMGFLSLLQIIPEKNTAFALLLNSFDFSILDNISNELLSKLTGIDLREPEPKSETSSVECWCVIGRYESFDTSFDVRLVKQQLIVDLRYKHDPAPPLSLTLHHVEAGFFISYTKDGRRGPNITFIEYNKQGIPQYLYSNKRLSPRQC